MTRLLHQLKNQVKYQIQDDYSELQSPLKYSYFEAFLTSFIVGIAENFFAAFSIEKGMSTIQSGLLLSLPLIFAIGLNLFFNFYAKKKSITKQVTQNVLLQIASLAGLITFAGVSVTGSDSTFFGLLALYSLYWYGSFSSQPAWNTWISEILSIDKGDNYFALRARLNQFGIIAGLIVGGVLMQSKFVDLPTLHLFGLLFGVAVLAQALKFYSFSKHQPSQSVMSFSFTKIKQILGANKKFFTSYALFNTSLFLSAPYVTGYLLKDRNIDYMHFMIITASLFVGKMTSTYFLKLKDTKYTPLQLMTVGGLVAAPLPLLWPICYNVESMYALHFVSGMSWGLWEVGLSLLFFKSISAQDKNETVTLYNAIGIMTQVIGTCIGALAIKYIFNYNFTAVFVCSGVIRFLCILPFQKVKSFIGTHPRSSLPSEGVSVTPQVPRAS